MDHHVNVGVELQSHPHDFLGIRNGGGENQAFRIFNARMAQDFTLAGIPVNDVSALFTYGGDRVYVHLHDDDFHPVVIQYSLKNAPRGAKPHQHHAPRVRRRERQAVHSAQVRKADAALLQPLDHRANLAVQDGIQGNGDDGRQNDGLVGVRRQNVVHEPHPG